MAFFHLLAGCVIHSPEQGRLNYPSMTARRRNTADHSIEVVGAQLRAMMPWIAKNKLVDQTRN